MRFFQSINFKIPMLFIVILFISFQFVGVFFIGQLKNQSIRTFKDQINTQVDFLVTNVGPILSEEQGTNDNLTEVKQQLYQKLDTFSTTSRTDVRIISAQGVLLASNHSQPSSQQERVTDRSVKQAIIEQKSYANVLYDSTTKQPRYYLIKPVFQTDSDKLAGLVEVKADMSKVYDQTASTANVFIRSVLVVGAVSSAVAFVLSQGLTRPIESIRSQALRVSSGDYTEQAEVYGTDELGELAQTMNQLSVKVQEAQTNIESERQRLDSVLKHMTDGVIATDRLGRVILINERGLRLLGLTEQEVLGYQITDFLQMERREFQKSLIDKEKELLVNVQQGDGLTVLKAEVSTIRREHGFSTGVVCVLTDITEQQKTEQERRDFVANVSHELRTPLTSIRSYTDTLSEGAWKDETIVPQFLSVIKFETERMVRMINDLLDLSKMDGQRYRLNMEYIDLKMMMDRILTRFEVVLQTSGQSKRYTIKREFTERPLYVEVDPDRMIQVIENIMNNAIKYSPDGGVVTIRLEENPSNVTISITDEGLGIPQKDLPYLFDRFYRVDKARSREQGGTGLGLAISKELVELHNGTISVTSVEGQGSTFAINIPYSTFDMDNEGWDDV